MAIVPFLISTAMLNFFNLGGMMEEINIILLLNLIIPPLMAVILDFPSLIKWWKRRNLKKFLETGEGTPVTQVEANEMMLGEEFPMADQYIYIFSTLATAFFYIAIFPLAIIYAVISLAVCYWVSKVKLYSLIFFSSTW